MAETTIIPVELKKLICWRVAQNDDNSHDDLVQKFMAAALTPRKVTPLDICDLRKTQRRVATLLKQAPLVTVPASNKRKQWKLPSISYVSRKESSNSGSVWAEHEHHPFETPSEDNQHDLSRNQAAKQNLYQPRKNRVHGPSATNGSLVENFRFPPLLQPNDVAGLVTKNRIPAINTDHLYELNGHVSSSRTFPAVGGRASMTSTSDTSDGRFGPLNVYDKYLDPNSAALHDWLLHTTTVESQQTCGSLKVDEDYVPMRVSVKKLATMDVAKDGTSLYQEFSNFFTSSSSAGSDCVPRSRDNTLLSIYTDSSSSFAPRTRSETWCTCPVDASKVLPSNGRPCLECGMSGGDHDGWCLSKGGVCLVCRRPVMSSRDGHSRDGPRLLGDIKKEMTDDALTIKKLRDDSFARKSSALSSHSGQTSGNKKSDRTETIYIQRVHFAKTVQEKIISRNSYNDASPNPPTSKDADNGILPITMSSTEHTDAEKKIPTKNAMITRIHPNIHRDAYALAVKDAHAHHPTRGKKKNKKHKGESSKTTSRPTGIIFSYFPLLRRPNCDLNERPIKDLGLRQDNGRKIKLKNAMKHILGKTKLEDYYPGGRKYFSPF